MTTTPAHLRPPIEVKIPPAAAAASDGAASSVAAALPDPQARPSEPMLSIVVPALNEAENLPVLHERLGELMGRIGVGRYELIVVDDGSTDGTLGVLRRLAAADGRVRYVSFTRNFGHQPAVRAGMDHARGDCVAVMDADLQHPPSLLEAMLAKWREGYDVVATVRRGSSRPSVFRRVSSWGFHRVLNFLGDSRVEPGMVDFYLLDRVVVDALKELPETEVFFRGLLPWLGFRSVKLAYTADERLHGDSKFSPRSLMSLGLTGVLATSIQPLRLAIVLALVVAALTLGHAAFALIAYFTGWVDVPGWTTIVLVVSTLGAMQLLVLGIIGEYLGRVLKETRRRPSYVVRSTNTETGPSRGDGDA